MTKDLTAQEYFENLYSLVKGFLNDYRQNVVNQIMNSEDYVEEPKRFFYTLLQKTASTIDAASIYIYNFDHKRDCHSALFIILRATISDLLVTEYIFNCSETDDEALVKLERLYFDHIDNVVRLCDSTFRHIYQWNVSETETQKNNLKANSRFYDSDGKPKYERLPTSLNKLIVEMYSKEKDKQVLNYHRRAYDLYNIFSKLEHLGELSFAMVHRGYDDKKQATLWFDLYDAILFIFLSLCAYPSIWEENLKYDKEHYLAIVNKIKELHPDRII
jgi:hypothetical protein